MNAKTLKARSRQQYRLLGRDRKPYLSRTPGRYGGYRPGAVCLPDQYTAWNHLAFDPAQTIRLQDRLQQLTTPTVIVWGTATSSSTSGGPTGSPTPSPGPAAAPASRAGGCCFPKSARMS
jgi:hypothetical protein